MICTKYTQEVNRKLLLYLVVGKLLETYRGGANGCDIVPKLLNHKGEWNVGLFVCFKLTTSLANKNQLTEE